MYAPDAGWDPDDGRTIQIVGYSMAGTALVFPVLGVAALVLGILTATKPGRAAHGAAIICLSVVLAVVGAFAWDALLR